MDAAKANQVVLTGCIIGWIILLSANPSKIAVLALNLTADTTLESNNISVIACPGETVVITCHTTGSLAWSSNEYVGGGGRQLTFAPNDRNKLKRCANNDCSAYAKLIDADNGIITSTFYITVPLNSSVILCTATGYTQNSSTISIRILDKPDVPEDPVAIQIRDTRYERCFIPVMWKNSANSVEAQVIHYTISINQHFMSNQTANLTNYSLLLETECSENHTVTISATNICGTTSSSTIYRTQSQDQQLCPVDTDTSNCNVTDIIPITGTPSEDSLKMSTTTHGYSKENCGNLLLMIACGTVVIMATYLLGRVSFKTLLIINS